MKFDSETYNKIYHAPEADSIEAGGGVVEPQAKLNAKENQNDEPTQSNNDINVNINLSANNAEVTGADADPEVESEAPVDNVAEVEQ